MVWAAVAGEGQEDSAAVIPWAKKMHDKRSDHTSLDWTTRVTVTLWGLTGSNGLVGDRKHDHERLEHLEEFHRRILGLLAMLRWMALAAIALLGYLGREGLAGVLAKLAGSV